MIALDTNVLVRYLTQDDPIQSRKATKLIENNCTKKNPAHITLIVLCELVWVLARAYDYDKLVIIKVLEQILLTIELDVENEDVTRRALDAFRDGKADFSDYVITYLNQAVGCEFTYSFDKQLVKHKLVKMPS